MINDNNIITTTFLTNSSDKHNYETLSEVSSQGTSVKFSKPFMSRAENTISYINV